MFKRGFSSKRRSAGLMGLGSFVVCLLLTPQSWGQPPSFDEGGSAPAIAQPAEINGVDVEEHLGASLPIDLRFRDDRGNIVRLSDYLGKGRPIIVSMNYSNCPMLCNTQLTGLINTLRDVKWTPGVEFDIVSVSLNPNETSSEAAATKRKYAEIYGRPGAETGWHFLTGADQDIRRLASAIGIKYKFLADIKQYVHPPVFILASPEGRIMRYFYGVRFEPARTLELSLVEASEGKIGSTLDRVIMYCLHFDTATGKYTPAVRNIMRLGAAATVAVLGCGVGLFWWRERRLRNAVELGGHFPAAMG
ncbi:SCO family protein [bacterium]|nr:SCO family protein [bacterium]